jgi:hypothetical protein
MQLIRERKRSSQIEEYLKKEKKEFNAFKEQKT